MPPQLHRVDTLGGRDNPLIRPSNYVVQLTHVFSPTIINELRGGFNRSAMHHYHYGTSPLSTVNGEPALCGGERAPASIVPVDIHSTTEVGTTIDGYDDLSIIRGRHTIKMGIGVERHRLNNSSEAKFADTGRSHTLARTISLTTFLMTISSSGS